jgi:zona occludens toxin (predicted ATPase)
VIECYEGRLGGGKTYSAVVRMVDHLRRGGFVCTNINVVPDAIARYIRRRYGVIMEHDQLLHLEDDQIGLFHRFTPSGTAELPVLVVIDEAHLTFNARDFAKTDRLYRETLTFLTQSRKVATDVIFIAQSVLNMDKQFMRLVQYIWRFRDLARWKIPGLGISYPFKQILAVQFDYDGRTILQRSFVRKDPAVFALYHTDHIVKPFPRLEVAKTKRTLAKTESKRNVAKILIPLGIVVGVIAAFMLYRNFTSLGKPAPGSTVVSTLQPAATGKSPSPAPSGSPTKDRGLYDVYRETFQAWNGQTKALKTIESGWYQVGEMSVRGYVTAVSNERAKIAQPDGRDGWVVATTASVPSPTVAAPTPEKSHEVIIAHHEPPLGIVTGVPVGPVGSSGAVSDSPTPTPTFFPKVKAR